MSWNLTKPNQIKPKFQPLDLAMCNNTGADGDSKQKEGVHAVSFPWIIDNPVNPTRMFAASGWLCKY